MKVLTKHSHSSSKTLTKTSDVGVQLGGTERPECDACAEDEHRHGNAHVMTSLKHRQEKKSENDTTEKTGSTSKKL